MMKAGIGFIEASVSYVIIYILEEVFITVRRNI